MFCWLLLCFLSLLRTSASFVCFVKLGCLSLARSQRCSFSLLFVTFDPACPVATGVCVVFFKLLRFRLPRSRWRLFCSVKLLCFCLPRCRRLLFFCLFVLFSLPVAAGVSCVLLVATFAFSLPRSSTRFRCFVKFVCLFEPAPLPQALYVFAYLFLFSLPRSRRCSFSLLFVISYPACLVTAGVFC